MLPTIRSFLLVTLSATLSFSVTAVRGADPTVPVIVQELQAGLIVHLHCGDGKLTAALHADGRFLVHGLDTDAEKVSRAREHLQEAGFHGPVSVDRFDGRSLPYTDNLVNFVVAENLGDVSLKEVMRVLAPGGSLLVREGGKWARSVKPRPANIDEWTHYRHDSSGNAVAHDEVIAPPGHLQWTTGPRYMRSHEHIPGLYSLVSARGRLFYIVDEAPIGFIKRTPVWRLVARDAFNGILLWKKPIEQWFPHIVNWGQTPPDLQQRLVAVGDRVYVTLGLHAPLSILDAATGKSLAVVDDTKGTQEVIWHQGTLLLVVRGITEEKLAELAKWKKLVSRRGSPVDDRDSADPLVKRLRAIQAKGGKAVLALEASSGRLLWRKEGADVSGLRPGTLSAQGDHVLYQTGKGVVCVDLKTGDGLWARPSGPLRAVHESSVYCADGKSVTALSLEDGEKRWTQPASLTQVRDLFIAGGSVWVGGFKPIEGKRGPSWGPYFATQRDLATGEILRHVEPENPGHHHRCYSNKATDRYILGGRRGTEFIDLETGEVLWHSWARGVCRYGVLPCNGLLYTPPHACACYVAAKLTGFSALAPMSLPITKPAKPASLEQGPAYATRAPASGSSSNTAWATYRGNSRRSGSTTVPVSADLQSLWKAQPGEKLTAPVVSDGTVLVATTNEHGVAALDATSGRSLWRFTAGGRVDSPPTLHEGRAIFGSRDGHVYSVRASDGALAWRLRAARAERRIVANDQLESVSPVHGSVLIQNGLLYFTAGRSSYLDGGIDLLRVEPDSGRLVSRTPIFSPDPETGRQPPHSAPAFMPGARSDILATDGKLVFLRDMAFGMGGDPVSKGTPHLFTLTDYLDDSWTHRSYWIFGDRCSISTGCSGRDRKLIYGRLLVFDEATIYGYGRDGVHWSNALQDGPYRVFAVARDGGAVRWKQVLPLRVRAMLLADTTLFLAGVQDEDSPAGSPPRKGRPGLLLALSASNGAVLARHRLDGPPVFDGIAAANGRLYISLEGGRLACLGRE